MRYCKAATTVLLAASCAPMSHLYAATLDVGFGSHKPPYVYELEDRGLEFELVASALRAGGDELRPYYAPAERLHRMFERGQLDAIATTNSDSGITAYYSTRYIDYQNIVVTLEGRDIKLERMADLAGLSVSAFQRARYLLGAEFNEIVARNRYYREEPRQISRNLLLYAGRVDAVIADERMFAAFNRLVADQVDVEQPVRVHRLFKPTPYSVGFIDRAAKERFDAGLAAIHASGEYARIMERYQAP